MLMRDSEGIASCRYRTGRRFQDLDYVQSGQAARDRAGPSADAIDETFRLCSECLRGRQMWRPHISGAITNPQLMGAVRRSVDGNPFVVYLDFLGRLQIVIHDHLTAT